MYLDSPLELCCRIDNYVLLDQTCRECAAEHRCPVSAGPCPLERFFRRQSVADAEETQQDRAGSSC